ncbi:MAG: type 4a pilus biogenesis protein PilO [Acidimicrobiales bacterium]|jgi:Tfp pilus assembly protein PilO
MNVAREYRIPLFIGAGALVLALILYAVLVAPQSSKLSSLHAQETQLQGQQTALQIKLAALKTEKQNLGKSCAELEKIATQIPSVQSPTDVDAEESSFESQFNGLAQASGVSLTQFSGFSPASTASAAPATTTGSKSPAGVVAVPTTLSVTGNYSQMTSFVSGLDNFPRLFVIQSFNLGFGQQASSSGSSSSGASSTETTVAAATSAKGAPLWVGGTATSPSAGPYSLAIVGSIYYTSTPNALDACTKATTSIH